MQASFGMRAFLAGMTPTLSPGLSSPTIPGSTAQGFEFVLKDMRIATLAIP